MQLNGAFITDQMFTREMRLEIKHMAEEGMSIEAIATAASNKFNQHIRYIIIAPGDAETVIAEDVIEPEGQPLQQPYGEKYPTWPKTIEAWTTKPGTWPSVDLRVKGNGVLAEPYVEGSLIEPITDERKLLDHASNSD